MSVSVSGKLDLLFKKECSLSVVHISVIPEVISIFFFINVQPTLSDLRWKSGEQKPDWKTALLLAVKKC